MKKVLLVATVQSHIAQFHKPLIEMLHENGCEVHVAARNNLAEKDGLTIDEADKVFDIPFARSPFSAKNIKAYKQLKNLIKTEKYDIVHCNTPVGGVLTRMACKKIKKDKPFVIYEAHGFHFYKGSSKKSWLLWYPIEKHFSRYTDTLITITAEDYALASKKFKCKTVLVHGVGINTKKYVEFSQERKVEIRQQYNLEPSSKIILCTGELNKNKNQILLIKAVPDIVKQYGDIHILFAGNGPLAGLLQEEAKKLSVERYITFLGYKTNLENFANIADVVVSCSFREGLPMNIAEAMWLAKPIVVSPNRGHRELIEDKKTGLIVDPLNCENLTNNIVYVLEHENESRQLGQAAKQASALYTDESIKQELYKIYFE